MLIIKYIFVGNSHLVCDSFFERHHRFAGWLATVFVWIYVCVADAVDPEGGFTSSGHRLARAQEFWYALFITLL